MSRLFHSAIGLFISTVLLASAIPARAWSMGQKPPTRKVNLAIWGNYISDEVIENFEKTTGIRLRITNYSSNEELLAKLQWGSSGIDIAVPSDYMVEILIKLNLLDKIENINLKKVDPAFLNSRYDPGNLYSVPYIWTTTGIAYNTEKIKPALRSWADVWARPELKNRISILDDVREALGIALRSQKFSGNSKDEKALQLAQEFLVQKKSQIKAFTTDTIDSLLNEDIYAAQAYSSDALQADQRSHGKIKFIHAEEGGTLAMDNLVLIKGAKHKEEALELIRFLLRPEVDLEKVIRIWGGPVLKETKAKLPTSLQNNKGLFPDKKALSKLERLQDLAEASKHYEEAWLKLKTQ